MVVVGLSACAGGQPKGSASKAGVTTESSGAKYAAIVQPAPEALSMPAGRVTRQYAITAPSPAKYAFNVRLSAPSDADLAVNLHTWYGAVLGVLAYGRNRQSCRTAGARMVCLLRFPLLPAQRAGAWTVLLSKASRPAAVVKVAINFYRP
jgi:hypothetical protein